MNCITLTVCQRYRYRRHRCIRPPAATYSQRESRHSPIAASATATVREMFNRPSRREHVPDNNDTSD
jgi:hypothetical protein